MEWYRANSAERKLYETLPLNQFVSLDKFRALSLRSPFIVFLFRKSALTFDLSLEPLVDIPIGTAQRICYSNITVGYAFSLPPKLPLVRVRELYCAWSRKPNFEAEAPHKYVVTNQLSVLGTSDAIAVVAKETFWSRTKEEYDDRIGRQA